MKKRCLKEIGLIIVLILITPLANSLSIEIKNLGQLGFGSTNPEYTSLRTVALEINYTQNASCRFSNDNIITWSQFELCTSQKYWLLSEGASPNPKTVFMQMNLTNTSIYFLNDTIYYNFTGAGLDTSPPTNATIINDAFSNSNSSISFSWGEAIDPESNLLKIPLIYSYQILVNDVVNNTWTLLDSEASVE